MNILNFRLEIANPFDRWEFFKNLGCLYGGLFKFKAWELEHTYYSGMLFDADLRWTCKQDHAGFELLVGVFGYGIHFRIYDTRHWNYETNSWEIYDFSKYEVDHYS